MRRFFRRAEEQRSDVSAVNFPIHRHSASSQFYECRKEIYGSRNRVAYAPAGDFSRPPRKRRFAHAALPSAAFSATQRACIAAVFTLREPRAVIARENNERVFRELQIAQSVEHSPYAPIHLLDPVTEVSIFRFAAKFLPWMHRHMDCGVRHVEEERACFIFRDETNRLVRVALGEAILFRACEHLDHLLIPHERDDGFVAANVFLHHVIRVGQTEVAFKTVACWKEFGLVADMPFSDAHRRVALRLHEFSDCVLLGIDADRCAGKKHTGNRNALSIASSQHLCARHGANWRSIKARKLHPLLCHAIQIRRAVFCRAKWPDVSIAHVIYENKNDVRFAHISGLERDERCEKCE